MDTCGKTNAELCNDITTTLVWHKASFDQVNAALQAVLIELQALCLSQNQNTSQANTSQLETNPFALEETTHQNTTHERSHRHLKLDFPKFNGDDPISWIYKAEQYFNFKNTPLDQQVQLATFHLEGIALQWPIWLTKFCGPLTWDEFTKAVHLCFVSTNYEDPSENLTRDTT